MTSTIDQVTEAEAIDIALSLMQKRIEELKPSIRECAAFGDGASHIAKREAGRYRRTKAAMEVIQKMKWYNV